MRDSFVLYTSYIDQIDLLSNEQKGILLTAIYSHVMETDLPEMDGMTKMAFSFIKSQLDKDLKKYEDVCRKRKEAGKSGGRPKANGLCDNQNKAKKANGFFENQTKAKKPDNEYEDEYENDIKDNMSSGTSADRPVYPYRDIIDYLNKKTGKAYRRNSSDTQKHIRARCAEGYKLEDFCKVIDNKTAEWKGTDMEQYLRPSTLFGTKFESYLNQQPVINRPTTAKKTRFSNFTERQNDYDALQKKLITDGINNGGMQ